MWRHVLELVTWFIVRSSVLLGMCVLEVVSEEKFEGSSRSKKTEREREIEAVG